MFASVGIVRKVSKVKSSVLITGRAEVRADDFESNCKRDVFLILHCFAWTCFLFVWISWQKTLEVFVDGEWTFELVFDVREFAD